MDENANGLAPEDKFVRLFAESYSRVARQVFLVVGDRETARDIAQESFSRLFERWERVGTYERPEAWVRMVALRLARRSLRAKRAARRALAKLPSMKAQGENPPFDGQLLATVLALPWGQRAAVALHYLEDLPVAEVAEVMGCKTSTVKVHLHRARKTLAAALEVMEERDVNRAR